MSLVSGLRTGVRSILRSGLNPGDSTVSMAGVAQDATSGIYCPASAAQWTTTLAVAGITTGNPSSLYLLQEAAGNPADSIGAFTLTAAGTLLYQQPVTGWTRLGITTTDGVAGSLQSVSASLPDIATTSCLLLLYVLLPLNAAVARTVAQLGSSFSTSARAEVVGVPKNLRGELDPNVANGAADATSVVRLIMIMVDRTNAVGVIASDLETLSPALTATPAGKTMMIGGDNVISNQPPLATNTYAVRFDGAAAELTLAKRRALATTLGWSIPW